MSKTRLGRALDGALGTKPTPASGKKSPSLKTLVRLGVTLALLFVAYSRIDAESLLSRLAQVPLATAGIVLVLYFCGQIISAYKWSLIMESAGLHRDTETILRAYFFGMFVNNFGLGTVGGDIARSLAVHPGKGSRATAVGTVMADRIHGLIVLLTIGVLSLHVVPIDGLLHDMLWPLTIGLIVGYLALGLYFQLRLWTLAERLPESSKLRKLSSALLNAIPHKFSTLLWISVVSAAFHCTQIFTHWVLIQALGFNIGLGYVFAVVPLVNTACSLPISINGVGVREEMYFALFPSWVPHEVSVAVGALWVITTTIVSALCGLLFPPDFVSAVADEGALEAGQTPHGTSKLRPVDLRPVDLRPVDLRPVDLGPVDLQSIQRDTSEVGVRQRRSTIAKS